MSEPLRTTYKTIDTDETAILQMLVPTDNGEKYLVVPKQYFDTRTEEIVEMDGMILIPYKDPHAIEVK